MRFLDLYFSTLVLNRALRYAGEILSLIKSLYAERH